MAGALRSETCSPRSCPVPGGESAQSTSEGPGSMDSIGLVRVIFDQGVRGDAPCITHGSIGQRSCGRPQVDFKPTFFLIPINRDTPTPPASFRSDCAVLRTDSSRRTKSVHSEERHHAGVTETHRCGGMTRRLQERSRHTRSAIHRTSGRFESASRRCCSTLIWRRPPEASHEAHNVHWSRLFRGPRQDRER